jgi:hypothetical protein
MSKENESEDGIVEGFFNTGIYTYTEVLDYSYSNPSISTKI